MDRYTTEVLKEARRAIASTLGKSEKALTKLKAGSPQHRMTTEAIAAWRAAIALIDRELEPEGAGASRAGEHTEAELEAAQNAIASARTRVEKMVPKFAPGTPQHTLAVRRIEAFHIAETLLQRETEQKTGKA